MPNAIQEDFFLFPRTGEKAMVKRNKSQLKEQGKEDEEKNSKGKVKGVRRLRETNSVTFIIY